MGKTSEIQGGRDASSPAAIRKFRRWISEGATLILDFDGTLVPICEKPSQVRLGASEREWIQGAGVARSGRVVLLSGRSPRDLARLTRKLGPIQRLGNHGARGVKFRKQSRPWVTFLNRYLKGETGVWVEDKGESLCVHYRGAPNRAKARMRIAEGVERLKGVQSFGGKCVVNVLPEGAPDKADAVLEILERGRPGGRVIFLGDDETDERVFRRVRALGLESRVQGVSVGRRSETNAPWVLLGQREVLPWLKKIAPQDDARLDSQGHENSRKSGRKSAQK